MDTPISEPTRAEYEDEFGLVVAVLAAFHREDYEGAVAALHGADWEVVAGNALGFLTRLGPVAAGSPERWAAMLADWRPGQRLGDGFEAR